MKFTHAVLFFFCVLALAISCNRVQYPDGFPKIYPCKVTVTDGGTPVSGATVKFDDGGELSKWGIFGKTDDSGTASMNTRGFEGAPLGNFKVCLEKYGDPVKEVSPGIYQPVEVKNEIDATYSEADTTPFSVTVEKKQASVPTFDVADGTTK